VPDQRSLGSPLPTRSTAWSSSCRPELRLRSGSAAPALSYWRWWWRWRRRWRHRCGRGGSTAPAPLNLRGDDQHQDSQGAPKPRAAPILRWCAHALTYQNRERLGRRDTLKARRQLWQETPFETVHSPGRRNIMDSNSRSGGTEAATPTARWPEHRGPRRAVAVRSARWPSPRRTACARRHARVKVSDRSCTRHPGLEGRAPCRRACRNPAR
jgi:hypothetical protein